MPSREMIDITEVEEKSIVKCLDKKAHQSLYKASLPFNPPFKIKWKTIRKFR